MSWNPLIHDCDGCQRRRGQPCVQRKADLWSGFCPQRTHAADRHRASTMHTSFVIEASANPLCYDCPRCSRTRGQPCVTRLETTRRGYCDERLAAMNEAVAQSKARRTKIIAVLLWSCGIHQTGYHELDKTRGRDGMLTQARGACCGSQYVSRIVMTDDVEQVELWNERDGWKEELCATS